MLSEVRISRIFHPRLCVIRSIDNLQFISNVWSTLKYEEVSLIRSGDLSISRRHCEIKYLLNLDKHNVLFSFDFGVLHASCNVQMFMLISFHCFQQHKSKLQIENSAMYR